MKNIFRKVDKDIQKAATTIKKAKRVVAYTGAGISVESGIPPFRGEDGLWNKYDPNLLDIDSFYSNPEESWQMIKKIFYDFFNKAKPNTAHKELAKMEKKGYLKAIVTQNIDNLHQEAGSKTVYEFHGNSKKLVCNACGYNVDINQEILKTIPPLCNNCSKVLKPDFIFFGEGIPEPANSKSFEEAGKADVMIVIGSTGEVYPAALVPRSAKQNGALIIEINPNFSHFTKSITDIYLNGKAGEIMKELTNLL